MGSEGLTKGSPKHTRPRKTAERKSSHLRRQAVVTMTGKFKVCVISTFSPCWKIQIQSDQVITRRLLAQCGATTGEVDESDDWKHLSDFPGLARAVPGYVPALSLRPVLKTDQLHADWKLFRYANTFKQIMSSWKRVCLPSWFYIWDLIHRVLILKCDPFPHHLIS